MGIIYKRRVLGKDRVLFTQYKIQTMYDDADEQLPSLLAERGLDGLGKIPDDPRIRPERRWMREEHVDEVPQLWNVAKGEMSPLGVRPYSEEEWTRYPEDLMDEALRYRPGLQDFMYADSDHGSIEFGEHVERMRTFLVRREENRILTDLVYFYKIWYNKLVKRMKSR